MIARLLYPPAHFSPRGITKVLLVVPDRTGVITVATAVVCNDLVGIQTETTQK